MNTSRPESKRVSLKILRRRRYYNPLVGMETMEDYALRPAPGGFRKWSCRLIANTALGGISFLALEAMGAKLIMDYGFINTLWAVLAVCAVVFLTGIPIAYYSAVHNVDIDLLTRGAGFGYIGSTITSLIYASFTFIFFSIEAAIMAEALALGFNIPKVTGYMICSIIIIPLVLYGVTLINRIQLYTQPLWVILFILPFASILISEPGVLARWSGFTGYSQTGTSFNILLFGSAVSFGFSIISQIGEQVDYLRFLPDKTPENRKEWWAALILAGPGWILPGSLKMLCGGFLAFWVWDKVHGQMVIEPVQLFLQGFSHFFSTPGAALFFTCFFVILSQIKINVTNAYAGSLAWSNFFSRLTYNHPGRVVWLFFNIFLSFLLMHFGLVFTISSVLAIYSNFAASWIGAISADLAVLKPLGISPSHIEFRRAFLYKINPVGTGAMFISSLISILCYTGIWGESLKAFSAVIALGLSFFLAIAIAVITGGRYYLARHANEFTGESEDTQMTCSICEKKYETRDMIFCPAYHEPVCSLCCSLDSLCHDACKKRMSRSGPAIYQKKENSFMSRIFKILPRIFLVHFFSVAGLLGLVFLCFYCLLSFSFPDQAYVFPLFIWFFIIILLFWGIWIWWFSLNQENRIRAEDQLDKHVLHLEQEIKVRKRAEISLRNGEEKLRRLNENLEEKVRKRTEKLEESYRSIRQADKMASLGILVAGMAHEINNPIGFISLNTGILQDAWKDILPALESDNAAYGDLEIAGMDLNYARQSIPKLLNGISQGANRVSGIVQNLKDYSRQHHRDLNGRVNINTALENVLALLENLIKKSTSRFNAVKEPDIPVFKGDMGSIEQVLINLIQNACQALPSPDCPVTIRTGTEKENIIFIIQDQGTGIPPEHLKHVTDPFFTTKRGKGGTGLGLSVSAGILEEHNARMSIKSKPGRGTCVTICFPRIRDHRKTSLPDAPSPCENQKYPGVLEQG